MKQNNLFMVAARRLLWVAALGLPALGVQAAVVFTSLYSFGSVTDTNGTPLDGEGPYAGLVQGSDGNFYGTTAGGGTNGGYGIVFTISTVGTLTSLYSFTGSNDGSNPQAGLVQGNDGYYYGTTFGGGTNGDGTVFKITSNGALTSLYSFTNGIDGTYPRAGLVQGTDGTLYGTTAGDEFTYGTVFKISTNGALTGLYSFSGVNGGSGGIQPYAGLVQGSDGYFYGTTRAGGDSSGTVFKINSDFVLPRFFLFPVDGIDGSRPNTLVQGSDGNFYGTAKSGGGTNDFGGGGGNGTVFKITTNAALTCLYSFTGGNDGADPEAALVQGGNGTLYGTTSSGGSSGNGTVFSINTNATSFTTLFSFSAGSTNASGVLTNSDGANPQAGLVLSGNTLYGTTTYGGTNGMGTVFELTIEPQLTITLSGTNMILSWPTSDTGYTLECATNLVPPVVWYATNVWNYFDGTTLTIIDGQNVVTNPISGSQMFYRLATAQNFGADWLGLRYAMKAAGALSYGHQHCLASGPDATYDMFYLPVPTHVIELANANPALCFEDTSISSGPPPGGGCPEQWQGYVGPQSRYSLVIVLPGSETGASCSGGNQPDF